MKQSNSRNSAFQLTASQGGWPHLAGWPLSVPYFNSQPHKEADKDVIVPSRPIWYFNSQPHKEADQQHSIRCRVLDHFNSQPHKEADSVRGRRGPPWRDFNSQPHKEADSCKLQMLGWQLYFNSQPHKEADITHILRRNAHTYFNSQPHKEADNVSGSSCFICSSISTHSLTRRLTYATPQQIGASAFQLTASQGGWPMVELQALKVRHFNSQPHKEADISLIALSELIKPFQLTASQGGWLE